MVYPSPTLLRPNTLLETPHIPTLADLFAGGISGAWYDPSDLTTVFQDLAGTVPGAIGQPVGMLKDKSGNNNHAIAPADANRPTLINFGGFNCLNFDGVDDRLIAPFVIGANIPFDRVSAWRTVSYTGMHFFNGASDFVGVMLQEGVSPQINMGRGTLDLAMRNGNWPLFTTAVISERYFVAVNSQLIVNRTAPTSGAVNVQAITGVSIGGAFNGGNPAAALFFGAFIRANSLTNAELIQVQDYIASKSGVVL